MYDFVLPPADTVAGDILRRAPPQLEASDGMVLANFTVASDDLTWVTIVSTTILSLTIIGATAILATMAYLEYKGRPGTTRQRIVQSLVISDLILGIVGLIGSALELSGKPLQAGTSTCDGLGFMLITVLWTEHLWTLSLAVATFLILIYPLHSATILLERHWYILWLFVWAVAIAVAITGIEIFGFYPAGGICYYGTNAGLYAELIQFIPRGLVFVAISILYWRLFVFLRRPDRIRGSFSDSTNSTTRGRLSNVLARHSGGRFTGLFGRIIGAPQPKTASEDERLRAEKVVRVESRAPRPSGAGGAGAGKDQGGRPTRIDLPQAGRPTGWPRSDRAANGADAEKLCADALDEGQLSPGTVPPMSPKTIGTPGMATPTQVQAPAEIPPWEKVQLPVFEVDGQRFGGSAANTAPRQSDGLWSNWKGLGAPRDGKRRPGTGGSSAGGSARHAPPFHRPSTATSDGASSGPRSPPMQARNQSDASGTLADQPVPAAAGTADGRPRWSSVQTDTTADWFDKDRSRKVSAASAGSATPSMSSGNLLGVPRGGAGQGRSASPALDASVHSRRTSATETARGLPASAPSIAGTYRHDGGIPPSETGSGVTTPRRRPSDMNMDLEAGPSRLPNPADADLDVDDEDGDDSDERLDFLRFLTEDGPHGSGEGPTASRGRWDGSGSSGEEYEFVEESMSSYLNRKTALLMLWFPLGYVLLFSVSLIRIIYDFVGNPPAELRAVSRWFIFAQGILDAIIYGVVEWHTKRVVRKRVRKGTFSPHGSRSARNGSQQESFPALTSALRGIRGSASRNATTSGGGGGHGAISSNRGRLRSQGGFGGASQLSYGQQGSPIVEEDPKTLMQAMDAISAPTSKATPPTAHGLRIGNLPAGMFPDGSDLAGDQRRGSEAPSVGSQLTHETLSGGSMTSNGASTKVSNSSARKGEDGVKRLDYADPKEGKGDP